MLRDLVRSGNRPERLAGMAYEWCSVICENHERLRDWAVIARTERHRGLVDVVFKSQESEVTADLLHAWTAEMGPTNRTHCPRCMVVLVMVCYPRRPHAYNALRGEEYVQMGPPQAHV